MLTDNNRYQMLTSKVGDMVRVIGKEVSKYNDKVGIIQYIGPILQVTDIHLEENLTWADRLQNNKNHIASSKSHSFDGTWFGIEFVVSFANDLI